MSKSGYSPHICYYASVLARAVQDDDDTFADLHDIVARRISSSSTKIDEIEKLAREYSDLPKHVLLKKIQWLEDRGIKPLRGGKGPKSSEQSKDLLSDKVEKCEEILQSLTATEKALPVFLDPTRPLAYAPEHGSLADICQKMEERQNQCFHVAKSHGDGNNNVQKADMAKKSYDVGLKNGGSTLTSSDSKDKGPIPEYTVISLDDYDVSSPVKFDFLQPTARTDPRGCPPFVEQGVAIEMQELKKEGDTIDSAWNWDPEDKIEPAPDSQRDENGSGKKKKKKKKPKKTGDESSTASVAVTSEGEIATSKPVSAAKSRNARRKKLLDALKLKQQNDEEARQSAPTPAENGNEETKSEPAIRRKRTIREYKLNQQKEALEKSAKTLTESSKLTSAPCPSYGSTADAFSVKELEPLMPSNGSQTTANEHKRPKREKKESKSKNGKQKDGQKSGSQDRTHFKTKSEKKPNGNKNERPPGQEATVSNTDGAESTNADSNDTQWPLLNQQLKHHDTYVPHSHESVGGAEAQVPKGGMSYASKVRNSLQLDSAGGSLASSCEDSSSSSSSNGTREYNVGAERSPSPASLPDMERKAVQDDVDPASKGEGASHGQVNAHAEFEPCAESALSLEPENIQENNELDCTPNIGEPSSAVLDTFSSEPAPSSDCEGPVVLPSTIEILLKNEWGLDFINENIVNDKTEDDAKEGAVNVTGTASSMLDFKFAGSELPESEPGTNAPPTREPRTAARTEQGTPSDGAGRANAQRKPAFDHQGALKFIWKEWLSVSEGKK